MRLPAQALVIGAGATGVAVTQVLTARGTTVRLADEADGDAQRERVKGVKKVDVRLGVDLADPALLDDIDLVVPSPGVSAHSQVFAHALQRGIPVWSEPELAARLNDGQSRVVAVTGTNGKTTTTELIGACLDAPTVGNIGTPMVHLLSDDDPPSVVVAELSSFQLHFTQELRVGVAVLLNLADDHLDWHGTLKEYRAAKARIWRNQDEDDWVIVNRDDDGARATVAAHPPHGRVAWFTLNSPQPGEVGVEEGWIVQRVMPDQPERVCAVDAMAAQGPHNVANACAAIAAALAEGAFVGDLAKVVTNFAPGPHRMQKVAHAAGVDWVNDSKATNPHAAAAALAAYPSIVWIAGGLNKDLSFDPLRELVAKQVRLVLTIGQSGPDIAALAHEAGVEVEQVQTIEAAVALAAERAQPGDTVLLSPACASMDQFRDYAHRGQTFVELALAATAEKQDEG